MKEINLELVKKYINGEEIEETSIDELENDIDFMMAVINVTNDYKIYNVCSDDLKENYDFIKFLVLKFKDNDTFIEQIAQDFLETTDDEFEIKELSIIMEKLLPKDKAKKYAIINGLNYYEDRMELEESAKNNKRNFKLGLGFYILYELCKESEIILDYYAKNMANDIFRENEISLENMIHNQYATLEKFEEVKINDYIINIIRCYDFMLCNYISTHLYLIDELVNQVKEIKKNWNNYGVIGEEERYNNMLDMVYEYICESGSTIDENELIYYIAEELGIKDKVVQYNQREMTEDDYMYLLEVDKFDIDDSNVDNYSDIDSEYYDKVTKDMFKNTLEHNIRDKKAYLDVKKIMINQIFSSHPKDLETILAKKEKPQTKEYKKSKIIKFDDNK